ANTNFRVRKPSRRCIRHSSGRYSTYKHVSSRDAKTSRDLPDPHTITHLIQSVIRRSACLCEIPRSARNDNAKNAIQVPVALTLCAMRSTLLLSSQGSSAVEQGTHKPLVGSSILPPGTPLLFLFRNIRREIFRASADCGHKANAFVLFDDAGPALLLNTAPSGKFPRLPRFRIALGRKKKKLHFLFHGPNLRDALAFFVVKHATAKCF